MINSFKILGESILQRDGYYDTDDINKKREIFLKNQAIVPIPPNDETRRAIFINFDTQKGKFDFGWDKEISPSNRNYFFAFSVGSSNDKKKFFSTNNINTFYNKFVDDSLDYIKKRREDSKTKKWFNENILEDYDSLIEYIGDTFYYQGENNKHILDQNKIQPSKRESLKGLEQDLKEQQKDKSKPISIKELFNTFINHEFFGKKTKSENNFPPIFLAKIDGEHILEYKDSKYKRSYINLVYFDLFERFFITNAKKNNVCHICTQKKDVIGEIPLLMKFYGVTNYLFFENLKNKEAYKSFAICRECLEKVLTGMKYTSTRLRDWLMGAFCYLIPEMENEEQGFEQKYRNIFKLLKSNKGIKEDVEEIEKLVKKSAKKDFYFNLLFFDSPAGSQDFDIIKFISNVEYRDLVSKLMLFDKLNKDYNLSILNNSISLNELRYNLFPSKFSHNNPDPTLYRKDLLDLLESFIHGYKVNYQVLIKRFTHIYRLRFHREKIDNLAPFKMVLILSIFHKVNALKGVEIMEGNNKNIATDIQNEDYKNFIEAHHEIYKKSPHRQGLFLLGTVINKIIYAQKGKSSTFMKKIDLSGVPARRVNRLVGEVKHFADIYEVYEEPGIWGNIMDRLQGIENTSMKSDEIVFYILTGISYDEYIGIIKSKLKNEMEEKEES